jgi:hypothetical protein
MLRKNVHKWRDFYNPYSKIFHIPDPPYFSSGRSVANLKEYVTEKVPFLFNIHCILKTFTTFLLKNQVIYRSL